ncbi:hypothetical protein J2W97_000796 [Paenibacillus jamilae]|jgi:hypothetical protein|uniref:hypothetical protein n=1 Tax=Paenibacillus polymyxa TaxID=1406 RepID=UPI001580F99D|nr:hypothetical protein [Paenibacillus polymyxa]MDP9674813.1 hypothetical protein [Paenibacillus jamilae]MBY0023815.1 hypothetical protein [Paenibacillus polymyxa]MBY0056487.1 hypothetical protein [Paenibacillus polymyxa]MBY0071834.1 hypothetical protein [Paenibacillus polymyxa]MBY0080600.1 hypothetical protein [Paenibacillus polymyxa]
MRTAVGKGTAAEFIAKADVLESGFDPETPSTATSIHDFTVAGLRVQVKRAENNGTTLKVDIRRPSASCRYYRKEDVDVFAIVDPISRRVAYIFFDELRYGRRLTLFLTREHTRAGLPTEYVPLYFDDYLGIDRVIGRGVNAA